MTFVINFLFSMFSTIAFSVITNIPRRAFLACGFTGAAGWMTFWILQTYCHQNIGISNFLGAMMIGLISIFFSRVMHVPVIVFNVPSLVPLVPGGPAYMAVRYMMNQEFTESMEKVVTVLVTAGAIAIGFMFTNLIERALKRTRSNFQLK
ncbi:threonine/serine exporter family protein [Enterococcus raffinosus]|uniref:threonine/serine exporter family protein n=1 Tax=Enterococcus raffinosus TaxID=71452 RepID=UPI00289013D7|nr:threonine/serine exporter family protein [Enterococcus raffinosus]MDT2571844.1 threonine/serine exporter family protein [Enterococcus raffinosus]